MKKVFCAIAFLAMLSGCSVLRENADKASSKVADGVNTYCDELDQGARGEFRAMVNAKAAPDKVEVTCEGDE